MSGPEPFGRHPVVSGSRERILTRIRDALVDRERVEHPGTFLGWRPGAPRGSGAAGGPGATPVDGFVALFHAAGGETAQVTDVGAAAAWLEGFAEDFPSIAFGRAVPAGLRPAMSEALVEAPPHDAGLGVSMARGAVAETGSLVMDARDGRRAQLLVPTHVVIVESSTIHATLVDALAALRSDLPSAIGFHSGPSKSADIGQIMVKGVHGPGRVVALIVGDHPAA